MPTVLLVIDNIQIHFITLQISPFLESAGAEFYVFPA